MLPLGKCCNHQAHNSRNCSKKKEKKKSHVMAPHWHLLSEQTSSCIECTVLLFNCSTVPQHSQTMSHHSSCFFTASLKIITCTSLIMFWTEYSQSFQIMLIQICVPALRLDFEMKTCELQVSHEFFRSDSQLVTGQQWCWWGSITIQMAWQEFSEQVCPDDWAKIENSDAKSHVCYPRGESRMSYVFKMQLSLAEERFPA